MPRGCEHDGEAYPQYSWNLNRMGWICTFSDMGPHRNCTDRCLYLCRYTMNMHSFLTSLTCTGSWIGLMTQPVVGHVPAESG